MEQRNLSLVLSGLGITEEALAAPSVQMEEDLRFLLARLYSGKKEQTARAVLSHLTRYNCYFAAKCCHGLAAPYRQEGEQLLTEQLRAHISGEAPHGNTPGRIVLALYQLRSYEQAGAYIRAFRAKKSDRDINRFHEDILSEGLPHVEDQVYLLCHCYNASLFFAPLSRLAVRYQWHCSIDPDAPYIDDFKKMLSDLLRLHQYDTLLSLLKILGKNREEARAIFFRYSGFETYSSLRGHLRSIATDYTHRSLDASQVYLELELAPAGVHHSLFQWLKKPYFQPSDMKRWLEFYVGLDEFCRCGTTQVLEQLRQKARPEEQFQPYLYPRGQELYLPKLKEAFDRVLADPEQGLPVLDLLGAIDGFNLFSDGQARSCRPAAVQFCSAQARRFRTRLQADKLYIRTLLTRLEELADAGLPAPQLRRLYCDTHLKSVLRRFEMDAVLSRCPGGEEELPAVRAAFGRWLALNGITDEASSPRPASSSLLLNRRRLSPSAPWVIRGGKAFSIFTVPAGSYIVKALSTFSRQEPFELRLYQYRRPDTGRPLLSDDDLLIKKHINERAFRLRVEEEQYVALLAPHCRCELISMPEDS